MKHPTKKYLTKTQSRQLIEMLEAIKAHDEKTKDRDPAEVWAERVKND